MKKGQISEKAQKRRHEMWKKIKSIASDGGTINDILRVTGWKNRAVACDFLNRHGMELVSLCGALPHNDKLPRMFARYMEPRR